MRPIPKSKAPHLKTSLKTLRGPFNIYPHFFFQQNWDNSWAQLLKLPLDSFKKENIQMLERCPAPYLEIKDKQILILSKIKNCLEALKSYRSQISQNTPHHQNDRGILKKQIHEELKLCEDFFKIHFNEKSTTYGEQKVFVLLGLSYLTFCEALLEDGNRSRKTMAIAHSFLLEIKEDGFNHPYFSYYEALLLIGRNKWNEATALLHATLKEKKENKDESLQPLARLLCKLYIFLDLPQVAKFISKRYFIKENLGHRPYIQKEWPYKKVA